MTLSPSLALGNAVITRPLNFIINGLTDSLKFFPATLKQFSQIERLLRLSRPTQGECPARSDCLQFIADVLDACFMDRSLIKAKGRTEKNYEKR